MGRGVESGPAIAAEIAAGGYTPSSTFHEKKTSYVRFSRGGVVASSTGEVEKNGQTLDRLLSCRSSTWESREPGREHNYWGMRLHCLSSIVRDVVAPVAGATQAPHSRYEAKESALIWAI